MLGIDLVRSYLGDMVFAEWNDVQRSKGGYWRNGGTRKAQILVVDYCQELAV